MKKTMKWLSALALTMMCAFCFTACGSDDDKSGSDGSTFSIIGTWKCYYERYETMVYDQVTFNNNHSGTLIEDVGQGSDTPHSFSWTYSGNTIQVVLDGGYQLTWQIKQIVDNNTVVIDNGTRTYTAYRQ